MHKHPVADAGAPAAAGTHVVGLDLFRFLLLLSVVVAHGFFLRAAYVSGTNDLAWPSKIITVFAMESFFLISGYVTAMAARIDGSWLIKRLKRLGIPLLFAVLVINNVTVAINPVVYRTMPLGFHFFHAWFIAALLGHAIVLRFCAGSINRLVPVLERRLTRATVLPVALGVLLAYEFLVAIVFKLTNRGEDRLEIELLIDNLLIYLPFFLGGYLLFRSKVIRDLLARLVPALAALAALAVPAIVFVEFHGLGHTLDTMAEVALKTCIGFSLSILILLWALAIRRVSPLVRLLSQGSYAVYVIHLLIANLLYRLFNAIGGSGVYGPAVLVTLVTLVIAYAVYGLIIRHNRAVRLLVTGSTAGGADPAPSLRVAARSTM